MVLMLMLSPPRVPKRSLQVFPRPQTHITRDDHSLCTRPRLQHLPWWWTYCRPRRCLLTRTGDEASSPRLTKDRETSSTTTYLHVRKKTDREFPRWETQAPQQKAQADELTDPSLKQKLQQAATVSVVDLSASVFVQKNKSNYKVRV